MPGRPRGPRYGDVVESVNVRVLLYEPVRNASLTPMCCRNVIATDALETGPIHDAGTISTRNGCGNENVPFIRCPGSETVSEASPAVEMTLAVVDAVYSRSTPAANAPKEAELLVSPTLRSSLFFRNGDQVQWALQPREGNLVERVTKLGNSAAMADELYAAILTRPPDADEKSAFEAWMEKHGAYKARALGDFTWALLSSTEFFVNH